MPSPPVQASSLAGISVLIVLLQQLAATGLPAGVAGWATPAASLATAAAAVFKSEAPAATPAA